MVVLAQPFPDVLIYNSHNPQSLAMPKERVPPGCPPCQAPRESSTEEGEVMEAPKNSAFSPSLSGQASGGKGNRQRCWPSASEGSEGGQEEGGGRSRASVASPRPGLARALSERG